MIALIIILAIWVLGIPVAYFAVLKNWDNDMFEKVWFSCVWPCLIPLYVIHWVHNNW